MNYNLWLPGDNVYTFGTVTRTLTTNSLAGGSSITCENFNLANASSGFGITRDMVDPAFTIKNPPKIRYSSTAEGRLVLKDAAGWLWGAPMPAQATVAERSWDWSQFTIAATQENSGTPPSSPNTSTNIEAFQFQGATGVSTITISLAYVSGKSPTPATSGTIRTATLTDRNSTAHTLSVGDVEVINGTRRDIRYYGSLPFGYMLGGPSRNSLSSAPYRGPYIAGYQSGTPWVELNNDTKLGNMLDFMLQSQIEFQDRSPTNIIGPFMHCYLPATWDSEQTGPLDTWVWDAPDGNPAWNGWQYRAIDAMGATWFAAYEKGSVHTSKARTICTRFLDWLYSWLLNNPTADYIPSDWGPPGWEQGIPLAPNQGLVPHGTTQEPHDIALAMKGTIFSTKAGYDEDKGKYMIRRFVRALFSMQVAPDSGPMAGAFSLNPAEFISYGFQQGEIHDALALALIHRELLQGGGEVEGPPRETEDGRIRRLEPGTGTSFYPVVSMNPTTLVMASKVGEITPPSMVTLTNSGNAKLSVTNIVSNVSQFTIDAAVPADLDPGQSLTFLVYFRPSSTTPVNGMVTISGNASPFVMTVSGIGTEEPAVLEPIISFPSSSFVFTGETVVGETSAIHTFAVHNIGTAPLELSDITVASPFNRVSSASVTVAAGSSTTIQVTFSPDVEGPASGTLTFTSNADGSPHSIPVSAVGGEVPVAPTFTWLSAVGSTLVDEDNQQVVLQGFNLYGMEGILMPNSLWARGMRTVTVNEDGVDVTHEGILDQMKRMGFNAVRLPICEDVTWPGRKIYGTNTISARLNPEFVHTPPALDSDSAGAAHVIDSILILDKIVDWCDELGIRIILDMHCLAPNTDNAAGTQGKWYTTSTPDAPGQTSGISGELRNEEQWIAAWEFLADRYKDRPVVCGFDLINEPHNCTWDDNALTGLPAALERCAERVHAINPNVMILCGGISGNVIFPLGEEWGVIWGGNLSGVRNRPVQLTHQNKVMYTPHEYANLGAGSGPPWIYDPRFPDVLEYAWDYIWGYIAKEGIAPILVGEFGGNFLPGQTMQHAWINKFNEYMIDLEQSWTYWAYNPGGSDTTGLQGLVKANYIDDNTQTLNALQPLLDFKPDIDPGPGPDPEPHGGQDRLLPSGDSRVTPNGDFRITPGT